MCFSLYFPQVVRFCNSVKIRRFRRSGDNIKFFQYLETLTKIASTGKHTFVIGDLNIHGVGSTKRIGK
ncbi:MAG: hypothetical protein DCF22_10215 [Leptolyngbya sp.]|nr:MAG: hypothetical protein DCF22_10215 [Leptolyngbya sp.]